MSQDLVKITIDGIELEVPKGTSVLEAARTIGIEIPHFCYHQDLSWSGTCRMCFVEVEKMPKLATACCTTVMPDMIVHTKTPKVIEARRAVLEFLLLNHPIDCPVCDQAGECKLQDYFMEYGLYDSNMPLEAKAHRGKVIRLGEHVVLDRERCILCKRCARFCDEVSGSHALKVEYRGNHTEITTHTDKPIEDAYSGCLPDVCPVGALTSAKFRFKCRVWFMDSADSICAGCSTGCNIRIDSYKNEIQRYFGRRNPDVNASWLCDEGRMSWTELQNVNRLEQPLAREDGALAPTDWDSAMETLIKKIRKAGPKVAAFASAQMSNEELFMLKTLVKNHCGSNLLEFRADDEYELVAEKEDEVLRRKDKNPNTRGALDLDIGEAGRDNILKAAQDGQFTLLLVYKQDLLEKMPDAQEIFDNENIFTIVFSPYRTKTAKAADLALPVADYFETSGTFTNYAGIKQRFEKAVNGPGETREGWQLLKDVMIELEEEIAFGTTASVTVALTEALDAKAEGIAKEEAAKQALADAEANAKQQVEEAQKQAESTKQQAVEQAVQNAKMEADMEKEEAVEEAVEEAEERFEEEKKKAVEEAVKKALEEQGKAG